jgi:predicted nucleic acid-binding protein
VPHLADVDVAQALRRYTRDGELNDADAAAALEDLRALDLRRHAQEPLRDRVWRLRRNLIACDAVSVALAEVLDAKLPSAGLPQRLWEAPEGDVAEAGRSSLTF